MTSHSMRRARRGVALRLRSHERRHRTPRRRRTPTAHLYPQHTHARSAFSSTCQAAAAAARLFSSPLSHVGVGVDATHISCGLWYRQPPRLCLGRTHTSVRASGAASRRPARVIASGGEGRGARPRAADEQLVGGGEGVCPLPSRKEGVRGIMRGDARAASCGCTGRDRGASSMHEGVGVTAVWGAGGAGRSSARKTCGTWS